MNAAKGEDSGRVIGTKQLIKYMEQDRVDEVILARDAEPRVTHRVLELARLKGVRVVYAPSMRELGRSCGIAVGAAAIGRLKNA